jgi:hypothetical protein
MINLSNIRIILILSIIDRLNSLSWNCYYCLRRILGGIINLRNTVGIILLRRNFLDWNSNSLGLSWRRKFLSLMLRRNIILERRRIIRLSRWGRLIILGIKLFFI